jgi:gamma-glutamyltranspeptidase/glutathione hydrolase
MMLLHLADQRRTFALDGSSRAPNRAIAETIERRHRRRGYRSSTVPSTPAALTYALRSYGTISLARALEPAIEIAESGYVVSELQSQLTRRELRHLRKGNAGMHFLSETGAAPRAGSLRRQPVLARTLMRIARDGVEDFYVGSIARAIHEDMENNGGLIRDDDLAQIPWPIERKPVATRLSSWRVVTFPPPGAGRVLIEMLNVLSELGERPIDFDTPQGAVLIAEVMRRGQLDRRDRPYDPAFYEQIDDRKMVSRDYARSLARGIRRRFRPPRTRGETTHLSVMDRFGNAVALTQSIEQVYGACVATPDLGFLYNDYMSAFDYEDIAHPYFLRPNAAPWASVAPTLVFGGRKPSIAIGSPGSERIVSAILQVLLRLRDRSPFEAVSAPRLHCSFAGKVSIEAPRFRGDVLEALEAQGFDLDEREAFAFYLGCVQLVRRERRGFVGVADPRRDGSAAGPRA